MILSVELNQPNVLVRFDCSIAVPFAEARGSDSALRAHDHRDYDSIGQAFDLIYGDSVSTFPRNPSKWVRWSMCCRHVSTSQGQEISNAASAISGCLPRMFAVMAAPPE